MQSNSRPQRRIMPGMAKWCRQVLWIIPAFLVITPVSAERIMSADELSSFVESYYLQPKPERIAGAIASLGPSGYAQKPAWGFVTFFSEVFAAHPEQLSKWKKIIARQDKTVRDFLQFSLNLIQSGGPLSLKEHSPQVNDMYWGAFFASGHPAYVRRLIDELMYCDERQDMQLFLSGATAKWSLLSNAKSHPLVRQILAQAKNDADPKLREILVIMDGQNATDVWRDIQDVLAQQKAAGVWQ